MFTAKMFNPSNGNFNVVINGKNYVVSTDHPAYEKLIKAYKSNDSEMFLENVNVVTAIKLKVEQSSLTDTGVTVTEEGVFYDGEPVDEFVCNHILEMVKQGFDIQPMVKFLENLYQNPDKNSVDQLYKFLQHKNMPITDDGCFIGYKTVREDYKDKYTGTIDNSVGQVVKMRRNAISNNPGHHCDQGLHVGALSYAGPGGWYNSSGDKVVLVKVNPKDAVSVPNDHNFTKLRVCEYEVIGEYVAPLESAVFTNSSKDYETFEEEYECEDTENNNCDEDVVFTLQKQRKISSQGPSSPKDVHVGQKLYIVFSDGSYSVDGIMLGNDFYFVEDVVVALGHEGEKTYLTLEDTYGIFHDVDMDLIEEMYYAY